MISHKHKCIFVHIPKCGGSSVESIIWPGERKESDLWMGFVSKYANKYQTGGLQHLHACQIKDEVGEEIFNGYFKFSFVRNPWDKAVSQFVYMKKRNDLMEFVGMKENDTFKKYLEIIQKKPHVQWCPQYKFIYDSFGKKMVDFVGRFERFEQDVMHILKKLGLVVVGIPHLNISIHQPYFEYYDCESMEMVSYIYKTDVERFSYTFSG